jgi:hypothetical protein
MHEFLPGKNPKSEPVTPKVGYERRRLRSHDMLVSRLDRHLDLSNLDRRADLSDFDRHLDLSTLDPGIPVFFQIRFTYSWSTPALSCSNSDRGHSDSTSHEYF